MENDRIIELMAKKLGRTATPEELEELRRLQEAQPRYGYLEEMVQSLKGSGEHIASNVPAQEVTETGWRHLAGRLNEEEEEPETVGKVRRLWPRWVAAASIAVALAGGAAWYFRPVRPMPSKALAVGYGDQRQLTLSDGTRIRLNAGSRLVYPARFTEATREVTLEGEAFFDVAPQSFKPFLVHAGKLTIKVLGTSFDVKAYKEDADITTTLISGKVQVTMDNDPERNVILTPHEKLVVAKSDPRRDGLRYQVRSVLPAEKISVGEKTSVAETAWMDDKLVFSDDTFEEVARQLERKYNVEIDFDTESLKDEHVSGVFEKETLQQVLDILRATTRFDYSQEGKKIMLIKALK